MLRMVLKFVVCVVPMVMFASVAFAQGTQPTSDQNNDGTITVYKSTGFDGDLGKAMNRWNALNGDAPKFRFVDSRPNAELVVWKKATNDCWSGMQFWTDRPDEIWLAGGCSEWIRPALHELGHSLGAEHHKCTSYWQRRTVMVSDPGGCAVKLWHPGTYDADFYRSLL